MRHSAGARPQLVVRCHNELPSESTIARTPENIVANTNADVELLVDNLLATLRAVAEG